MRESRPSLGTLLVVKLVYGLGAGFISAGEIAPIEPRGALRVQRFHHAPPVIEIVGDFMSSAARSVHKRNSPRTIWKAQLPHMLMNIWSGFPVRWRNRAPARKLGRPRQRNILEPIGMPPPADSETPTLSHRVLGTGECIDQSQSFCQMADRLQVRRPVPRSKPCLQPVAAAFSDRPASVKWCATNSGCAAAMWGNWASSTSAIRRWNCWRFAFTSELYAASTRRACLKI